MIGTINKDKQGASLYQPSRDVADFTAMVKQDYQSGWNNLHTPFEELNNKSVVERMNIDQRMWNSFVDDAPTDPDEAWRWHGIRPITRNKILSIAAHTTAQVMVPNVFAQNENDEEDKMTANVMKWLMKWNIKESDYEHSFLFAVIGALVNPVSYLQADYFEVMQKIKERQENGEITETEIVDEILSGLKATVLPADEIMITNAYEFEHQRQKAVIRRRFIEYDEAQAIYGDHPNWGAVQLGIRAIYNSEDGLFYDQYDEDLGSLVEEVTYYNRREDTQVTFVNGIYLGDENVEANPFTHRDNRNAPKYPQAKTGYEPIDEKKFYYYKSAVNKLSHDQELVDRMWQMTMDGTFLDTMPPVALSGDDSLSSSVYFPGRVTSFNEDTVIKPIETGRNLSSAYRGLQEIERSMSQSSQSDIRGGASPEGNPTAFEISRLETNANIQLGLFGKMLGKFVVDFGSLMIDNIIQHQTVAEVDEILGGQTRLKFRTFLLPDEKEDGKKITRTIRFSEELIGTPMNDKQVKDRERKLRAEADKKGDVRIYEVNPAKFRNMKFSLFVNPDNMLPKNKNFEKILNLEAYDRLIADPVIASDPEAMQAVTRDFLLNVFAEGEADKYLPQRAEAIMGIDPNKLAGLRKNTTSPLVAQASGISSDKQLMKQV